MKYGSTSSQPQPLVVVLRLAAHVDHAVDRGAAADHLAARIVEGAAAETGFGLGLEQPIRARIADAVEITNRDVDPVVIVITAGLQEQDLVRRIGGQPVRQHATGAAGADNDVIVGPEVPGHVVPSLKSFFISFAVRLAAGKRRRGRQFVMA